MIKRELRPYFNRLVFRTFPNSFFNDLKQIETIAKPKDYLIVDFSEDKTDLEDLDIDDIIKKIKQI